MTLSLLGSTAAVAQRDNQDYQRNNQNYQNQPADPRQNSGGRYDPQGFNEPGNDRPHWSRGDRLPDQYRQNQYIVGGWSQHNLRTPPRGNWSQRQRPILLTAMRAASFTIE
jgi:Ni/Co efflux regulator RcnB